MEQSQSRVRRVVLKIGTGILTSGVGQLDTAKIMAIGREVAALRAAGSQVLIVSSGAVGLGMGKLGLTKRPSKLTSVQKCAAVGQSILIDTWQRAFTPFGLTVAQLLLYTRDNLGLARAALGGQGSLMDEILADGIVPDHQRKRFRQYRGIEIRRQRHALRPRGQPGGCGFAGYYFRRRRAWWTARGQG